MTSPVLVTGAAGFIGSALCRSLVAGGQRVLGIDKLGYASTLEALALLRGEAGFDFVQADILQQGAIEGLLRNHGVGSVAHLAAETHVDRSIDRPLDFVTNNALGTAVLLEAVRSYLRDAPAGIRDGFRLVHVSTDEVYGALGPSDPAFGPDSRYAPSSPYAATKAASDHLARAWHHSFGLPVIVSSCSNNYGPWQYPEKLIPVTIARAEAGQPVLVYGRGLQVRDWLHVDDHADAISLMLRRGRPGATYLVGGRAERTNVAVVEAILGELDRVQPRADGRSRLGLIAFTDDRPGHDFRYAINPRATEKELGWAATREFESGLVDTVQWYLSNRAWWGGLSAAGRVGERQGVGR